MQSEAVRELRLKMDMSQEEFADLLGVSRRTVGNWERGGAIQPSSERRLKELADTLRAQSDQAEVELSLADEVAELRQRVDYLEAIVLTNRVDELAARRQAHAERPPLRGVADSHVDADLHSEGQQEEP